MCGIAGIVRTDGLGDDDLRAAARFPELLAHRGPDGSGCYQDRWCAAAQTRLALVGPARQTLPARSPDGRYVLVYNGEVYNYEELRQELGVAACNDTEVVLAAWIQWGRAALSRLNGMFAFFVWDAARRRGFGACDPLGVKPFLYHHARGYFAFASEAGSLVESGAVRFAPHDEAIAESLTAPYFSGATDLPFADISRLPLGYYLEFCDGHLELTRYYRFERAGMAPTNEAAFVEELADAVEASAAAAMRADTRVGVFLSGGVDSSLLAAAAQRRSATPIPVWTIAYDGQSVASYSRSLIVKSPDLPYAERVAAWHGCDHIVVNVDAARYEAALEETLRSNDLICAWEQEISQQVLAAAAAAQGVKAVLVGDAADETHFGYSFLLDPDRIASPRRILDFFGTVPLRESFLRDPAGHFTDRYVRFAESHGHSWRSPHDQRLAMSCLIFHLWLTRLLHNGDIHLMAHSVEGRVPFADLRLLALAQLAPEELAYRDGVEKWHLRRAAERFLDPEIAWRPKSALAKNLCAHGAMQRAFVRAWREWGGSIERYVDCDAVERLARQNPVEEVEVGLRFRLLALMTWSARFSGAHA